MGQKSAKISGVKIRDEFWSPIQDLVMEEMLPYQADVLEDKADVTEKSHAVQNLRIAAGETKGEYHGLVFQDSDLAKWLEAVAYALNVKPIPNLEKKVDEIIDLIGRAQQADGYLNTYFTVKEPERKWQNLQECHELYCSGHMIEAAIAYYEATGKDKFLNIMRRNADLICSKFGPPESGKERGIPGHQEIELALLRLHEITGEKSYLETAQYFLDERGREPDFFMEETEKRDWKHFGMDPANREYAQNHLPAKEQAHAVGHSVRGIYMYSAMAKLAAETGDEEWLNACRALWENITGKRMYITGGLGSTVAGEAFTIDYDLPNDTIYAETCASIAMVFFARYMLEIEPKGKYGDIMELQLYNGALSGMQLDGKRFFYVNPLEVVPGVSGVLHGFKHVKPQRPEWYACACCPPNLARLITSLGQYAWGENKDTVFNHLYLGGRADLELAQIGCETNYPWDGSIKYTVTPKQGRNFKLAIRIPGWCNQYKIKIKDKEYESEEIGGYMYIQREWSPDDIVEVKLHMEPKRIYANSMVRAAAGCVALQRGPIVYCLEEVDNHPNLAALRLPRTSKLKAIQHNGITVLEADGLRLEAEAALYSDVPPKTQPVTLRAVPYYYWGNRKPGGMRVWIQEG
ncbi:MAG: glycoside hydrolase family 127 protein [Defluviitaleaceae bacterium]|nr:glycoside hydrolase family 127 protein [Defluviitaleaceae bacterium]